MLVQPTYEGLIPFDTESSSVPPQETSVNADDGFVIEAASLPHHINQRFRHSSWASDRQRVWDALRKRVGTFNRCVAFKSCGSGATVVRDLDNPGDYAIRANYCHDRFCKPCARARSAYIAGNIADIAPAGSLRFLTLTIQDHNTSLEDTIDHIYKAFRRLRAGTGWKRNVLGGAAFLETKWNDQSERWHTHIHVIIEGCFYPQPQLKQEWTAATGGATIVHITKIRNRQMTLRYITKYGSKGIDTATLRNPERLVEAMIALHGRRLVITFGAWRKLQTKPKPSPTTWEHVAPLHILLIKAAHGDPSALYIVGKLGALRGIAIARDYLKDPPCTQTSS